MEHIMKFYTFRPKVKINIIVDPCPAEHDSSRFCLVLLPDQISVIVNEMGV